MEGRPACAHSLMTRGDSSTVRPLSRITKGKHRAMATKKQEPKQEQPKELPTPSYPSIESFIEKAKAGDVGEAFKSLKSEIEGLKGPRADQGKKVSKAIERTEELLSYLLQVREKLEAERKGKPGSRK